jgi:hypothetical protein
VEEVRRRRKRTRSPERRVFHGPTHGVSHGSDTDEWVDDAATREGFVQDEEDLVFADIQTSTRAGSPGLDVAYSDVDDDTNPVFYSFGEASSSGTRDSHLSGLSLSDNESTVGPEEEREEQEPNSKDPNSKERPPAAYHVLDSQYAGEGYAEGHHSVKVTAVLSERATVPQSLFRWMYVSLKCSISSC